MIWWAWLLIILGILFIIFMLLRMDWSLLFDEDSDFMEKLKVIGDACCLGTIFRRK